MSAFRKALAEHNGDPEGRRWLFVPYDQLSGDLGPLSREDPSELGIVLVETLWKGNRRPYHRQKLALLLANLRHFALEQAERGVCVRHVVGDAPYAALLEPIARELGALRTMRPAERELRVDLAPLIQKQLLQEIPHEGWLTTSDQFDAALGDHQNWRMDAFYRHVRKATGILMEDGQYAGGKLSFDAENRKPWRGDPPAPRPPTFPIDAIKQEVVDCVESDFSAHPGEIDASALPGSAKDAERAWRWAKRHALPHFGPFEDAMSLQSRSLFHTQISGLMNLHRLLPARIVRDVARMDLPIASQEGFIRQVLGWREFMHHVHDKTDGFRALPEGAAPECAGKPGDGGWSRWSGRRWKSTPNPKRLDGGACPSALAAEAPLPAAYWGTTSGLHCLDTVVSEVWQTGYGHHISRLMVLANLATLLGVSPRETTDWFWAAYADAYDWVVEPNVLGMGTFALGDLVTTTPYVSGAAYIHRMSDYCSECEFSPKKDCPITSLYWNFLERNETTLSELPRLAMPLRSLAKRGPPRRKLDRRVAEWTRETLEAGEALDGDARPT